MSEMVQAHLIHAGNNDRKQFNQKKLRELAASIAKNGLAQPPTVRPIYRCEACDTETWQETCHTHGAIIFSHYQIVCGERRVRAMRDILKWTEVPCEIRPMNDQTASDIMLAENAARVDLNPIEEANSYFLRIQAYSYSIQEMAQVAGVHVGDVQNALRLLKLVPEVQHLVATYQMTVAYAVRLSDLDTNRQRIAMQVYIKAKNMPQWRWVEVINRLLQAQNAEIALPGFEAMLVAQATVAARVRTGKKAITGAPVNEKLPAVRYSHGDSMARTFERYIQDLEASGWNDAAAAVGHIYTSFVARAIVNLPETITLDRSDLPAGKFPMQRID